MGYDVLKHLGWIEISGLKEDFSSFKSLFSHALKIDDKEGALEEYAAFKEQVTARLNHLASLGSRSLFGKTRKKYEKVLAKYKQELIARGWLAD